MFEVTFHIHTLLKFGWQVKMDFRFITNMILLTTYSASSKFNKMLVKSAATQTFVMLVVFLLVCLLVLQPVEVQAGIASDFSSKGSRNVNSVMTKSGRALYQTKLVDIPKSPEKSEI